MRAVRLVLVVWGVGLALLAGITGSARARAGTAPSMWLAYYGQDSSYLGSLYRVHVLHRDPQRLASSTAAYRPGWSPDGRWIAFAAAGADGASLMRVRNDGSRADVLADLPGTEGEPVYSPDGRWIAFHYDDGRQFDVYRVRADGSALQRLTRQPEGAVGPVWSPDGRWIVFMAAEGGVVNIYRMQPDGSGIRRITDTRSGASFPSWSPDSRWLVFVGYDDGSTPRVYGVSRDGGTPVPVSLENVWSPQWSPDGQWIAVIYNQNVYRMRPNGWAFQPLTHYSTGGVSRLVWSPDGRRLAYVYSSGQPTSDLVWMRADGSDSEVLIRAPLYFSELAWSPPLRSSYRAALPLSLAAVSIAAGLGLMPRWLKEVADVRVRRDRPGQTLPPADRPGQ